MEIVAADDVFEAQVHGQVPEWLWTSYQSATICTVSLSACVLWHRSYWSEEVTCDGETIRGNTAGELIRLSLMRQIYMLLGHMLPRLSVLVWMKRTFLHALHIFKNFRPNSGTWYFVVPDARKYRSGRCWNCALRRGQIVLLNWKWNVCHQPVDVRVAQENGFIGMQALKDVVAAMECAGRQVIAFTGEPLGVKTPPAPEFHLHCNEIKALNVHLIGQ